MTTNYEYDDEDDFTDGGDVVKQLRKVNKSLDKRAKELEQELASLRQQSRQSTVKDLLSSKGVNPKVAAFLPQDLEPTEENIDNWIAEYGDVFNVKQQQASSVKTPELSANARINNVVNSGQPPLPDEDIMAKIATASSAEELNAILGVSVF